MRVYSTVILHDDEETFLWHLLVILKRKKIQNSLKMLLKKCSLKNIFKILPWFSTTQWCGTLSKKVKISRTYLRESQSYSLFFCFTSTFGPLMCVRLIGHGYNFRFNDRYTCTYCLWFSWKRYRVYLKQKDFIKCRN